MDPLAQLRRLIAALDETVVDALGVRARLPRNERLYPPGAPRPEPLVLASRFARVDTPAARVGVLRPAYRDLVLPRLCEPSGAAGPAPFAADAACLDALARRLSLSVHVATRKREAVPPELQAAIASRDPAQVEAAITFPAVEEEVLARVRARAAGAGRPDLPERIAGIYADWLIPLSRKIQVHGLLDREPVPEPLPPRDGK